MRPRVAVGLLAAVLAARAGTGASEARTVRFSGASACAPAHTAAGGVHARHNLRMLPVRQRRALDEATVAAVGTLTPISEISQVAVVGS